MWFVLTKFTEGWDVSSGPHRDKEVARMAMMKDAKPDGPSYGLAYVEAVGRVETYTKWLKVEETDAVHNQG